MKNGYCFRTSDGNLYPIHEVGIETFRKGEADTRAQLGFDPVGMPFYFARVPVDVPEGEPPESRPVFFPKPVRGCEIFELVPVAT